MPIQSARRSSGRPRLLLQCSMAGGSFARPCFQDRGIWQEWSDPPNRFTERTDGDAETRPGMALVSGRGCCAVPLPYWGSNARISLADNALRYKRMSSSCPSQNASSNPAPG